MSYVIEDVGRELGVRTMPSVLSGTSAGGINVAALAAFADAPLEGIKQLRDAWCALRLDQTVRPSSVELLSMFLDVSGAPARWRRALRACTIRGGVLDPRPIANEIERVPIDRIADHVRAGLLDGVAISATRVASGEAVVFYDGTNVKPWSPRELAIPVATRMTREHVLASAAIPLIFPAVQIVDDLYCDGGLRQMVPLSPAVHLGATRLFVVNPLASTPGVQTPPPKTMMTSPLYLAGKAIDALFADRVEMDLSRLEHTNAILRAGRRRFGDGFEHELNEELAREQQAPLAEVAALGIEPTQSLGALAADYVVSKTFAKRADGAAGRMLRWLADSDPQRAGDLLGFLMFDGGFTAQLIELGRADASAKHDEICAMFM